MPTSLIQEWIYALLKELNQHKGKAAVCFALVLIAVVTTGFLWPKKYESSAIIYADDQNIIKPLLAGQAETTRPDVDQLAMVRERITSNQILEQVLLEAKLVDSVDDKYRVQPLVRALQSGISVSEAGRNHTRISFRATDPAQAFLLASTITNVFISNSARIKRQESGEAYTFIDSQVKTYKEQLQSAEEKLKNFRTTHAEGGEDSAAKRVSDLRSSLESQTLELQIARARRDELRQQLNHESEYIAQRYKADVYRDAMAQAQSRLDTLRLSYQETYPDIVSLKQQIADLERTIKQTQNQPMSTGSSQGSAANPVYQKLKADLSDAEVQVRTLELRVNSTQRLLDTEVGHSRQSAEYQAQLAELTRDYNVTRQIYEDMLERKEKARLSVALDVQGQGLNYRIQEPPVYPTAPVGLRFIHFFLAAPLLGLLAPIALLVAYILLDPRMRFVDKIESALPDSVPVLAVVPHVTTPFERRVLRSQWNYIGIFIAVLLLVYAVVAVARLTGVI